MSLEDGVAVPELSPPEYVRVVVDSTETKDRWSLDNSEWRTLGGLVDEGLLSLYIPEVVVRESQRQLSAQQRADAKTLGQILQRAERFSGLSIDQKKELLDVLTSADTVDPTAFRDLVGERGFDILPLPAVGHMTLLNRDLDRRKPFADTGKGYRDALNWHSVLELAQDRSAELIYWVTANTHDFGDGGLHPHLVADLGAVENPARVVLVTSLRKLIEQEVLRRLIAERLRLLDLQARPDPSISELVESAVLSAADNLVFTPVSLTPDLELGGGGLFLEGVHLPPNFEEVTISEALPVPGSFLLERMERFDEVTTFATASVAADIRLDGYLYKGDVSHDDRLSVTNFDWNDHYAEVSLEVGEARLTFDLQIDSDSVESCELQGVESAKPERDEGGDPH